MLVLLGLVNLFALAGFVGYLFASGRLNAERVEQIAMVLRGEFPETEVATSQPADAEPPPEASEAEIARIRANREYYELLADRHKREIEDRRGLGQQIRSETLVLLKEIERREDAFKKEQAKMLEESQQLGFARQLEVLSKIDPKKAKNLLKEHTKEPDAVQLLMQMDANRVSKIVNACDQEDEKVWIGRILNQIGTYRNEAANGVDGPVASADGGG